MTFNYDLLDGTVALTCGRLKDLKHYHQKEGVTLTPKRSKPSHSIFGHLQQPMLKCFVM